MQDVLLPVFKPLHLCSRLAEELHFHLLELTHTEDKLACNNLIAESLSYLADTKWQLHTTRLLNIEKVNEDTLRRLWAKIDLIGSLS